MLSTNTIKHHLYRMVYVISNLREISMLTLQESQGDNYGSSGQRKIQRKQLTPGTPASLLPWPPAPTHPTPSPQSGPTLAWIVGHRQPRAEADWQVCKQGLPQAHCRQRVQSRVSPAPHNKQNSASGQRTSL